MVNTREDLEEFLEELKRYYKKNGEQPVELRKIISDLCAMLEVEDKV